MDPTAKRESKNIHKAKSHKHDKFVCPTVKPTFDILTLISLERPQSHTIWGMCSVGLHHYLALITANKNTSADDIIKKPDSPNEWSTLSCHNLNVPLNTNISKTNALVMGIDWQEGK
jgi:hypothetical protein